MTFDPKRTFGTDNDHHVVPNGKAPTAVASEISEIDEAYAAAQDARSCGTLSDMARFCGYGTGTVQDMVRFLRAAEERERKARRS